MKDTRNVTDEYKGMEMTTIKKDLAARSVVLEIAVENLVRDFNMGTIIRTANAFNVRRVHVIGSRQWNKRGAMATDKYLDIQYHQTTELFIAAMREAKKTIVAVDIVPTAIPLLQIPLEKDAVLVFGAEGPGISQALLAKSDRVVFIEQAGSTRSLNVGVAAGIAMHEWVRIHGLTR